jgi:RNA polymerase sigma factor (sigma-70 family)
MARTAGTSLNRIWAMVRPEGDAALLEKFLEHGDESAFTALVQRHAAMVYGICRRLLPSAVDAEDAVQATFLILAQRGAGVRKKTSLRSWLYGVALRVSRSMRRRQARLYRRERFAAEAPIVLAPSELLADGDLEELLRREVARLPEQYRLPLELCYWHGQSREEMAATLGWTPGMVKGQLERAKRRLRSRLVQQGVQLVLPLGIGLAALGAMSLLPRLASAATTATQVSTVVSVGMRSASLVTRAVYFACRLCQTTKGLASVGICAATLGLWPAWGERAPLPASALKPAIVESSPVPHYTTNTANTANTEWQVEANADAQHQQ